MSSNERQYYGDLPKDSRNTLWICVWGGVNTIAQALIDLRASHSNAEIGRAISRQQISQSQIRMGSPLWLGQTVKTQFAVRCKILNRQDHFIAF